MTIPIIIAKEKLRVLSPPRIKIATNTINVLTDVFMVRDNVSFIDSLNNF